MHIQAQAKIQKNVLPGLGILSFNTINKNEPYFAKGDYIDCHEKKLVLQSTRWSLGRRQYQWRMEEEEHEEEQEENRDDEYKVQERCVNKISLDTAEDIQVVMCR